MLLEFLQKPWPWHTSGLVISAIMLFLILSGKSFGFSSNFRTACAALGFGKKIPFFDFDWKAQRWNLLFALGAVIGGWISAQFLTADAAPILSEGALADLTKLGLSAPTDFQPTEIFSFEFLFTAKGVIVLVIGGFLVGFGTRWAGGCTSGHAISGLSDLQWPSLLAVIGFFIGGLVVTWFVWPFLIAHF
jgi:uncharacterized membrane protein YedE/YeeE